ncbi:MAG: hypothetical protein AAF557_02140 [Pseudomonadota bacterium]
MAEIKNREDLEKWLSARPEDTRRADAALIASRAVLRVLPLLARALDSKENIRRSNYLLPIYRALIVACFAGAWSGPAKKLKFAARNARSVTYALARSDAPATVAHVAAAAASAASTTYAFSSHDNTDIFAGARAAADADAALVASLSSGNRAALWGSINWDTSSLELPHDHTRIANRPIWQDGRVPIWANVTWQMFYELLKGGGEGWEVWRNWYEQRFDGHWQRPHSQALELSICQIPDDVWEAGPATANARIAELIEKHVPTSQESIDPAEGKTWRQLSSLERTREQSETDFMVDASVNRISAVPLAEDRPSLDDPFRKNDLGAKLSGLKDFARELHTDIKEDHPEAPGPLRRDFDRYAREAGKNQLDVSIKILHRRAVRFEAAMQEEGIKRALGNYVLSKFQDFLADHHALMAEHFTNVIEVMKRNDAVPIPKTTTLVHFEQGFEAAADLLSGPA